MRGRSSSAALSQTTCLGGCRPCPRELQRAFALEEHSPPIVLYTDAQGSGGLGALVCAGSEAVWWASAAPPEVTGLFQPRRTQINPLELLAAFVGLHDLGPRMRGKVVLLFIDNTAALGALKKGGSSHRDLNALAHLTHAACEQWSARLVALWVPSAMNAADPPSRGRAAALGVERQVRAPWGVVRAALSRESLG